MSIFKDMDDNQFWLTLWTMAGTILMTIVALIAWNVANKNVLLADMINKGHNPIEVSCLFNSSSTAMVTPCLLIGQARANTMLEKANVSK